MRLAYHLSPLLLIRGEITSNTLLRSMTKRWIYPQWIFGYRQQMIKVMN